jgi:hypothetical protein
MKTLAIIIIAWFGFSTTQAQQKIEKHLAFSGKEDIVLKIQIADSIRLQTWDKNEVFVTASVNINENKDNDAYLTSFDETGKTIVVSAKFRDNYFKGRNNCCIKSDIYWQVFVPEKAVFSIETINADIIITGETEKMTVKTISGCIDLSFPVNKPANLEFSTISGTVYTNHDLLPERTGREIPTMIREKMNNGGSLVRLETISGDIFFRRSILK